MTGKHNVLILTVTLLVIGIVIPANGTFFPNRGDSRRRQSPKAEAEDYRRRTKAMDEPGENSESESEETVDSRQTLLRQRSTVENIQDRRHSVSREGNMPGTHHSQVEHPTYPHEHLEGEHHRHHLGHSHIYLPEYQLLHSAVSRRVRSIDHGCEWKMVFKAVAGNGRLVSADYPYFGDINVDVPQAMDINNELVYRNGGILDNWNMHAIDQVKIELFTDGKLSTWFLFNGEGSGLFTWMTRERLISFPYNLLADLEIPYYYTMEGDGMGNIFSIMAGEYLFCSLFLLTVLDDCLGPCPGCFLENLPHFIYATDATLGSFILGGEYSTFGFADRLVISTRICNEDLWMA